MRVRQLEIGDGRPKICVSVTGKNEDEILEQIKQVRASKADLAEWRIDYYRDASDLEKVGELLCKIREALQDMPLLFTFRTKEEGGEREIGQQDYEHLNVYAAKSGYVDMIDVELEKSEQGVATMRKAIEEMKGTEVYIVASYHDFNKTPPVQEMVQRLGKMKQQGAHIVKLAVMPKDRQDVLNLMRATIETMGDVPVVTMSMGELGKISRIAGSFTGSAITFGAIGEASAPGQMDCDKLCRILDWLD